MRTLDKINKRNYRYIENLLERSIKPIKGVSKVEIEIVNNHDFQTHHFVIQCSFSLGDDDFETIQLDGILLEGFKDDWEFRQQLMVKLPELYKSIIFHTEIPELICEENKNE